MRLGQMMVGAVAGVTLALTSAAAQAVPAPLPTGETRLQGANRYETSAEISRRSFEPPVDAVDVATGTDYADALAGGPAAAGRDAPVLLVEPDSVPAAAAAELARLAPSTIYILGGTTAVNSGVEGQLANYAGSVVRLNGANRYETAAAVSRDGWDGAGVVVVSSGATYADALSGGAAAAELEAPLLLTAQSSLSAPTATELVRLQPTRVLLLGGPAAVSASVESGIRNSLPAAEIVRIAGQNRYDTSAKVARTVWPSGSRALVYATGSGFADALAGTPAAHVNAAPIVLTAKTCLPAEIAALQRDLQPSTRVVLGGTSAISAQALANECGTTRYSGVGDSVIPIVKPGGADRPAIAAFSHQGESNFAVWGLDASLERTDLLVNEIGDYTGRVLLDADDWNEPTRSLEITADGPWRVAITAASAAKPFSGRTVSGTGDDVVVWNGGVSTALLTHDGASNFAVWGYVGDWPELLVNEIGDYSGTVRWPGAGLYEIAADGRWSISVN